MQEHSVYRPEEGGRLFSDKRHTATRADLLEGVAFACPGLSRGETRDVFETVLEEVSAALIRGESVKFRGFGLFAVREKRERVGRNPRTGVEVPIKPRRVLTFKPSPVLNDLVNGQAGGGDPASVVKPVGSTRKAL